MSTPQGRTASELAGPAKWFGAGVIITGSAAALIGTLAWHQPRTLPPMMATAPVQSVESAPIEPIAPKPETAISEAPRTPSPAAPLSPLMASMLAPSAATATAEALPVAPPAPAPTNAPKPAPTNPAPQPAPAGPSATKPAAPKPPTPQPAVTPTTTPAVSGGTINVNTATSAELELLPQIGPAMAARIIEYRTTHGQFKSLSDLDKVKGIGSKTLEKLKPLIRFE